MPKDFHGHICTVFFTTLRVRDREVLDPGYLALFLRTSLGRFQFQSMITETAYPVIGDDDVESMTILLPKIDVQRALVASYEVAVTNYFTGLNAALHTLVTARQGVEDGIVDRRGEAGSSRRRTGARGFGGGDGGTLGRGRLGPRPFRGADREWLHS